MQSLSSSAVHKKVHVGLPEAALLDGNQTGPLQLFHIVAGLPGLGLVTLIHGVDPACIYIGGEITVAWDMIEPVIRSILTERSLSGEEIRTAIVPSKLEHPRLRGAAALVSAPMFSVPRLT